MSNGIVPIVLVLGLWCNLAVAQTSMMHKMKILSATKRTGQIWESNSSSTQNQGFTFPGSAGSVGQVITVETASDGIASFKWTTPSGGYTSLSSVVDVDKSTSSTWAQGDTITLTRGQWYRIVGEFRVYRATGGGASDKIKLGLSQMPTNTVAEFMIECLNCVSTTDFPLRLSTAGGTSLESDNLDPDGTQVAVGSANTFMYRLEGVIQPGGSGATGTGGVSFGFNKNQGSNDVVLLKDSYWTAFPLPAD